MTYYISRSGQQYGPYPLSELQNMLAQGQILATDHAWSEGMASWTPVSEVLASAAGPAVQPAQHKPAAYEPAPEKPAQPQYQPQQPYQQQPQYQPVQDYQSPPPLYPQGQAGYGPGAAPAAAPYAAPAYGAGYAQQPVAGAVPPGMHWFVLLLLGCLTGGILMWIWMFVEASFVKKIAPRNKATMWLLLGILGTLGSLGIFVYVFAQAHFQAHFGFAALRDPEAVTALVNWIVAYFKENVALIIAYYVGSLLGAICMIVGFFSMRGAIQRYYNSVEPIGLRLSGVMTFFFNILYFQYHFRRIARWKSTGQLS
jgi:GYF domain 2